MNIIVLRISLTLTGNQAIRDDIISRLHNPLIMKQPSKWRIYPFNCNILFNWWNNISELIMMFSTWCRCIDLSFLNKSVVYR